MHLQPLLLSSLLSLTTAHFQTTWPPARGFSEKTASNFPCGGFDSVSNNNRTDFPIGGSPIELNLEHTQTNLAVYIAIASDPGSSYNIVLRPQFAEQGPGSFCIGAITLPSNVNVSGDGVPATIQVVSNGDPTGGLYQVGCASIHFVSTSAIAPAMFYLLYVQVMSWILVSLTSHTVLGRHAEDGLPLTERLQLALHQRDKRQGHDGKYQRQS